jgi:hypothetical protein
MFSTMPWSYVFCFQPNYSDFALSVVHSIRKLVLLSIRNHDNVLTQFKFFQSLANLASCLMQDGKQPLKVYLNKYLLLYLLLAAASYNHSVFNRQPSCEDIIQGLFMACVQRKDYLLKKHQERVFEPVSVLYI